MRMITGRAWKPSTHHPREWRVICSAPDIDRHPRGYSTWPQAI